MSRAPWQLHLKFLVLFAYHKLKCNCHGCKSLQLNRAMNSSWVAPHDNYILNFWFHFLIPTLRWIFMVCKSWQMYQTMQLSWVARHDSYTILLQFFYDFHAMTATSYFSNSSFAYQNVEVVLLWDATHDKFIVWCIYHDLHPMKTTPQRSDPFILFRRWGALLIKCMSWIYHLLHSSLLNH